MKYTYDIKVEIEADDLETARRMFEAMVSDLEFDWEHIDKARINPPDDVSKSYERLKSAGLT